jgi:hypothetical protein
MSLEADSKFCRDVNPLAQDFILQCLRVDPSARPSAAELKAHPLLQQHRQNQRGDRNGILAKGQSKSMRVKAAPTPVVPTAPASAEKPPLPPAPAAAAGGKAPESPAPAIAPAHLLGQSRKALLRRTITFAGGAFRSSASGAGSDVAELNPRVSGPVRDSVGTATSSLDPAEEERPWHGGVVKAAGTSSSSSRRSLFQMFRPSGKASTAAASKTTSRSSLGQAVAESLALDDAEGTAAAAAAAAGAAGAGAAGRKGLNKVSFGEVPAQGGLLKGHNKVSFGESSAPAIASAGPGLVKQGSGESDLSSALAEEERDRDRTASEGDNAGGSEGNPTAKKGGLFSRLRPNRSDSGPALKTNSAAAAAAAAPHATRFRDQGAHQGMVRPVQCFSPLFCLCILVRCSLCWIAT